MAEFELARGLMQLSGLAEQRRAKKEEERFNKAYREPYFKALTDLQNAQVDKMMDVDLREAETRFKEAQAFGAETESMKAFDAYRLAQQMIDSGDEDKMSMARNWFMEMKGGEDFRKQIDLMQVGLAKDRNVISAQGVEISRLGFALKEAGFITSLLLSDEFMDKLEKVAGKEGKKAFEKGAIEDISRQKALEKDETSIFDRIKSLLDDAAAGKFGTGAAPPFGGGVQAQPPPRTRTAAPPAKPPSKAAPKKAPKAVDQEEITMDEFVPISAKAQENNVDPKDIYIGIQKLVQLFPEMTKEDKLGAADKIAEGFTIEEVIKHYQSVKGKDE